VNRATLLGGLVVASIAPLAAGQQAPVRSQFRAGTDLVAVDFQAVDDRGQPIADLKPAELVLRVDGRVRDLRALQFVKIAPTSREAPRPPSNLPLPYATNDVPAPGRVVILVVDLQQIRAGEGKVVIDAANGLIDRLTPTDRVGLVTMPNGRVDVDLTVHHARVRKALEGVTGKAPRPGGLWTIGLAEAIAILTEQPASDKPVTDLVISRECRYAGTDSTCQSAVVQEAIRIAREMRLATRTSLMALTEFLEGVVAVDGPKTVVYISGGLISSDESTVDLQDLSRAAAAARAQLYILQPHQAMLDTTTRGVPPSLAQDDELRHGGLEDLAGTTGGVLFRLAAMADQAFTRVADEISGYYLLGFEPRPAERDGRPHKIELTTSRNGVVIRARPTFVIGAAEAADTPVVTRAMLRDFAAHQDLPLRTAAFAFRHTDAANVRIAVALEPTEPSATLTAAGFALIDPQGRVAAEWAEEGANVVARPVLSAVVLPPGEYRLRAVAVDTAGRRGSVDYEFSARLTDAAPLRLGPLMVGDSGNGRFSLQLQPAIDAPTLTAYTEVYGDMPLKTPMAVTFEIAATPDGPALVSGRGTVLATADIDRRVATAVLPLDKLAPGDFIVRAVVHFDGKVVGTTSRTLRRR
jgi:VWFA-related protein